MDGTQKVSSSQNDGVARDKTFSSSPFYIEGKDVFPNEVDQVKQGGLYVMDDAGGVVFQLFTDPTDQPSGTIDLNDKKAEIYASPNSIKATSYKQSAPNGEQSPVTHDASLCIHNLVPTNRRGLKSGKKFMVTIKGKEGQAFSLYNVHDLNGQTPVIHTRRPICDPKQPTKTEIHGMVYVENDTIVYMGYLEKVTITIEDHNGHFCDDS